MKSFNIAFLSYFYLRKLTHICSHVDLRGTQRIVLALISILQRKLCTGLLQFNHTLGVLFLLHSSCVSWQV